MVPFIHRLYAGGRRLRRLANLRAARSFDVPIRRSNRLSRAIANRSANEGWGRIDISVDFEAGAARGAGAAAAARSLRGVSRVAARRQSLEKARRSLVRGPSRVMRTKRTAFSPILACGTGVSVRMLTPLVTLSGCLPPLVKSLPRRRRPALGGNPGDQVFVLTGSAGFSCSVAAHRAGSSARWD